MRVGQPCFVAKAANQQWAIDFAHDPMVNGRTLHVLSIVDTFTRECLALTCRKAAASVRFIHPFTALFSGL